MVVLAYDVFLYKIASSGYFVLNVIPVCYAS